jgi:tetratricopeptide (TPR) repeat protein
VERYRVLLRGQLSVDERFDLACKIGRLQREELNDQPAALGSYLQALELQPDDIGVLHELVEIHTQNRHWSRAVDTLERLVSLTSGRDKVCYLSALASILNCELDSHVEAVALYDRALDEDPSDRRTFERLERILIERQQWRELTRAYRRMIKRIGACSTPEERAWSLTLWRALADTCRRYLRDLPAATAACEVCVSLDPEDKRQHETLAELYEAQGRDGYSKAVGAREHLLALTQDAETAAKHIRALARLHAKFQQYDRLFCASAALCVLTKADARERAFYESNAPQGVALAKTVLTEKQWQGHLCSSRKNHLIGQVLAAVAPGLIMARAKDTSAYGLDPKHRAELEGDSSLVSRLLIYVSRLIGVPLPAVYVPPGAPGEVDLVVLLEDGKPVPALVLGRDLVVGRTHQELAFLVTKKLVGLRADHFLLWPQTRAEPQRAAGDSGGSHQVGAAQVRIARGRRVGRAQVRRVPPQGVARLADRACRRGRGTSPCRDRQHGLSCGVVRGLRRDRQPRRPAGERRCGRGRARDRPRGTGAPHPSRGHHLEPSLLERFRRLPRSARTLRPG